MQIYLLYIEENTLNHRLKEILKRNMNFKIFKAKAFNDAYDIKKKNKIITTT
jgi:hypothetical protein